MVEHQIDSPPEAKPMWRILMKQRCRGSGRQTTRGLTARVEIPKATRVVDFCVEGIFKKHIDALLDEDGVTHYVFKIRGRWLRLKKINMKYNPTKEYNNKVANLVNHASSKYANLEVKYSWKNFDSPSDLHLFLVSKKRIKKGENLFFNYEDAKWTSTFWTQKKNNKRKYPFLCQGTKKPKTKKPEETKDNENVKKAKTSKS